MKKSGRILILAFVLCFTISMRTTASPAGAGPQGKAAASGQESFDTSVIGGADFSEEGEFPSSEGSDGEQDPDPSEGNTEDPGPSEGGDDQDPSEGDTGDQDPGASEDSPTDDQSGSGDGDTSEETVTPEDPADDPGHSGEGGTESGAEGSGEGDDSDGDYSGDVDEDDDEDYDDDSDEGSAGQNAGTAVQRGIARISVVDAVSASRLDGASMSVVDPEGTVVLTWESGGEVEVIRDLEFGKEYTIKQDRPPKGYRRAADLKFTIDENNKVTLIEEIPASEGATSGEAATASEAATAVSATTTDEAGNTVILVRNEMNVVRVLTVDASDRKAVEGAKLRVFTNDGTTVDEWVSGPEAHAVERIEAGTYTLREINTPDSYLPAEDIEFTVDEKGKIATAGAVMTDEEGQTVLLVENSALSFVVTKVAADTGESVEGAELALFEAENGNVGTAVSGGAAPIAVWTSEKDGSYDFGRYMRRGAEYVLSEITSPDGFEPIEDIPITVEESGEIRADLPSGQADNGSLVYLVEGTRAKATAPVEPAKKTNNRLFSLLGDHAPVKLAAIVAVAAAAVVFVIRGAIRS